MEDLNRLKMILVEKKRTRKWLAEEFGKNPSTVSNGVQMLVSRIYRLYMGLRNYSKLILMI